MKTTLVQSSLPPSLSIKGFSFLLLLLKQTPGKIMTIYFRRDAKVPASSHRLVFNYENLLYQCCFFQDFSELLPLSFSGEMK